MKRTLYWRLLVCVLLVGVTGETETVPTRTVWAVPGGDTRLPCDLTHNGDTIGMVMWFKDDVRMPLYTLDFRNGPLVHWAVSDDLGSRSHFVLDEAILANAHLAISKVSQEDQGLYRCRIDFINSPTKNFKVNLTVAVPPEEMRLYDGEGREILGSSTGPFREGHDLLLSCQVMGGNPRPEVTWWRGREPLDSLIDTSNRGSVISQLYLSSLTRNMSGAKLQCRVETISLLPPMVKEVTLKLYLRPLTAKIRTSGAVRAGHEKSFVCITRGSKPAPNIDWFLETKKIDSTKTVVEVNGDVTKSVLTWAPKRVDDGRQLSCRVSNPWLPVATIEDTLRLDLVYPPSVNITLLSQEEALTLREDEDATLRCLAKSKPPPFNYTFFKENAEIRHDPVAGFLINGSELMLRNIQRHHSANYKCRAVNTEGYGDSRALTVKILYRPTCATGSAVSSVRGIGGVVRARCAVSAPHDAGPLRFYWTYNSTKDVLPIPATNVTINGNVSTVIHGIDEGEGHDDLKFNPTIFDPNENMIETSNDVLKGEPELGWLACWASNDIGNQREPCLYKIVPADLPSPPKNCEVIAETMQVRCEPGDDGGLKQHFVLEVLEAVPSPTASPSIENNDIATMNDQAVLATVTPVYKARGESPIFPLNSLPRGKRYVLMVYAETNRGRSPKPALAHYTDATVASSGPLQVLTPSHKSDNSAALIVGGALTLVLLSLVTVLCVSVVVMCKKRNTTSRRNYLDHPETRNVGVCMYSGGTVTATLPLQLGAVMVRPGSVASGNVRASRVSARWSNALDDMPHITVLTPIATEEYSSSSSFEENDRREAETIT